MDSPPLRSVRSLASLGTHYSYFVTSVLEQLGPELVVGTQQTLQQVIAALFVAAASMEVRQSIAYRAQREGEAAGIDVAATFCELFPRAPEEQRESTFWLLDSERPAADPCVLAVIMAAYEQVARSVADERCGEIVPWEHMASLWLRKEVADPRVVPWARDLARRVTDPCRRGTLGRLRPGQR